MKKLYIIFIIFYLLYPLWGFSKDTKDKKLSDSTIININKNIFKQKIKSFIKSKEILFKEKLTNKSKELDKNGCLYKRRTETVEENINKEIEELRKYVKLHTLKIKFIIEPKQCNVRCPSGVSYADDEIASILLNKPYKTIKRCYNLKKAATCKSPFEEIKFNYEKFVLVNKSNNLETVEVIVDNNYIPDIPKRFWKTKVDFYYKVTIKNYDWTDLNRHSLSRVEERHLKKSFYIGELTLYLPDYFKYTIKDVENTIKGQIINLEEPGFSEVILKGPDDISMIHRFIYVKKEHTEYELNSKKVSSGFNAGILKNSTVNYVIKTYYKIPISAVKYLKDNVKKLGTKVIVRTNFPYKNYKVSDPKFSFKDNFMIVSANVTIQGGSMNEIVKQIVKENLTHSKLCFNGEIYLSGFNDIKNTKAEHNVKLINFCSSGIEYSLSFHDLKIELEDSDFYIPLHKIKDKPHGHKIKIYAKINNIDLEISKLSDEFTSEIIEDALLKNTTIKEYMKEKDFYFYPISLKKFMAKKINPGKYKAYVTLYKNIMPEIFEINKRAIVSNVINFKVNKLKTYSLLVDLKKHFLIVNNGPSNMGGYSAKWNTTQGIIVTNFFKSGNSWMTQFKGSKNVFVKKVDIYSPKNEVVSTIEIRDFKLKLQFPGKDTIVMKYYAPKNFVEDVNNPLKVYIYNVPKDLKGKIACKWSLKSNPFVPKKNEFDFKKPFEFRPFYGSAGKVENTDYYTPIHFMSKSNAWCGVNLIIRENPEFVGKNLKIDVELVMKTN